MGTQQLLLIALGVIVVGLMVLTGISIMQAYSESSNREQIIANMYDLGLMAQTYYKKNSQMGGGGGFYTRWSIPLQLRNTPSGTFTASVQATRVDLSCTGKYNGRNRTSPVRVTARINVSGIRITIVN